MILLMVQNSGKSPVEIGSFIPLSIGIYVSQVEEFFHQQFILVVTPPSRLTHQQYVVHVSDYNSNIRKTSLASYI